MHFSFDHHLLYPAAAFILAMIFMTLLRHAWWRRARGPELMAVVAAGVLVAVALVVSDHESVSIPLTFLLVLALSLILGDAVAISACAIWRRVRAR